MHWLVLKLLLTSSVFIPLERVFPRRPQPALRNGWREDVMYFLMASILVQALTLLSVTTLHLPKHVEIVELQAAIASQSFILQLLEIMILADFIQYWMHRLSHRLPLLWRSHAIHHSATTLDWLVGSRMHLLEVIGLRALTVIPMYVLGFSHAALYAYLVVVVLHATYAHSNVRGDIEWLKHIIVTPRFHHWHHGVEKEAIDVNFAIHFPILDRLFGTYYLPPERWPLGYGIPEKVPAGLLRQFMYPFTRSN